MLNIRIEGLANEKGFTLSPILVRQLTPKVASLWYRAPELLLGDNVYNEAIDNWAAGLIIAELLVGYPIIKGDTEIDQVNKMFRLLGEPDAAILPVLKDMSIYRCKYLNKSTGLIYVQDETKNFLTLLMPFITSKSGIKFLHGFLLYDPDHRVTARKALQSPFFTEHPLPTSPRLMPTFPDRSIINPR